MDAEYLKANIGEVLASGLASCCISNPDDPVDHLARWLLKYVENQNKADKIKALETKFKKLDHEIALAEVKMEKETEKRIQEADRIQELTDRQFRNSLNNATNFDGLFQLFCESIRDITSASGTYIGEFEGPDFYSLKYLAATLPNDAFLLDDPDLRLEKTDTFSPISFKLLDEPEDNGRIEEPEIDPETGEPIEVEPAEPELRHVYVPDVLIGPGSESVQFWRLPRVGCYFAMHVSYEAFLNNTVLEECASIERTRQEQEEEEAENEDEESEEPLSDEDEAKKDPHAGMSPEEIEELKKDKEEAIKQQKDRELYEELEQHRTRRQFAICFDTIGQDRRFNDEEIAVMKQWGKMLQKTLVRIDLNMFKEERKRRAALITFNDSQGEINEDDILDDVAKWKSDYLREHPDMDDMDDSEATFRYHRHQILTMKSVIMDWKEHEMFRGPLHVLQCFFIILEYPRNSVSDHKGLPHWGKMRQLFDDKLIKRVQLYDPALPQFRPEKRRKIKKKKVVPVALEDEEQDEDGENIPYVNDEQHQAFEDRMMRETIIDKEDRKFTKACEAMLEDENFETVGEKNKPLAEILQFLQAAFQMKEKEREDRAENREKEKETEEERIDELREKEKDRRAKEAERLAQLEQDEGDEGDDSED